MDEETRTLAVSRPNEAARRAVRVTEVGGEAEGVSREGRVVIGRSPRADVRLTDPTVSLFHCEVEVQGDVIAVRDLGSRNGTSSAGVRIREGAVRSGSELSVGSCRVRVEIAGDVNVPETDEGPFAHIVGRSRAIRELRAALVRLARTDLPVLIEGPTGSGKELVARGLHAASPRASGPLVVLDCTSIPPTLAESVLFGHEKGAFTGANERRAGVFEAANGGTLFIDELGELSMELQPKLLRALERREIVPLGSTRPRTVDVRVVSATWRDLRVRINDGAFRDDLYFRLAHARVRIPSLAERPDDVEPLVRHALARLPKEGVGARAIADEALALLSARAYPGNVRELFATVERAALLAEGDTLTAADLAFERRLTRETDRAESASTPAPGEVGDFKTEKQSMIDEFERTYLERLLQRSGANISRAAQLAGIGRHTLRELMRRHGLRDDGS